ncbi:MAG: alpha/beta-type small acid-soluble spore protein [Eubacteriaceae bacterium]|nr:alpha/beta-type small acid-soluble spore protein [Eubacteriaceae bacterium]
MAKSSSAKRALQPLKDQIAGSLGVNLSDGANLTTAQVGHVGGQMVKKMIDSYTGTSSTSFRG